MKTIWSEVIMHHLPSVLEWEWFIILGRNEKIYFINVDSTIWEQWRGRVWERKREREDKDGERWGGKEWERGRDRKEEIPYYTTFEKKFNEMKTKFNPRPHNKQTRYHQKPRWCTLLKKTPTTNNCTTIQSRAYKLLKLLKKSLLILSYSWVTSCISQHHHFLSWLCFQSSTWRPTSPPL